MKLIPILLILLCLTETTIAQDFIADDSLQTFVQRKYEISLRGTHALLTWSVINIGTGIFGNCNERWQ